MKKLIGKESILINAPVWRIWEILTKTVYLKKWFTLKAEFGPGTELKQGSGILWKDEKGNPYARGFIIEFKSNKIIRTSPTFYNWKRLVDATDFNESYQLSREKGGVRLTHTYGDFAKIPDGRDLYKEYIKSATPENKELEKIKELAEKTTKSR